MVAPTVRYIFVVLITDGCAFCDRCDIGGSKPPPYRRDIYFLFGQQTKQRYNPRPLFSLAQKAQREKLSVKNIVVSCANAWRTPDTPCFFLFSRWLHRPQDAPTWKSKEKTPFRRFRSLRRATKALPLETASLWKGLSETFLRRSQ